MLLTHRHNTSIVNVTWAPSQYPKRRLSVRCRKVSKPRDLYLELSDRSEIWQALRQRCCRCACQISKRYDNLKYQSRGFETLRDLTERRLFGYWDGALVVSSVIKGHSRGSYGNYEDNRGCQRDSVVIGGQKQRPFCVCTQPMWDGRIHKWPLHNWHYSLLYTVLWVW